MTSGRIEIPILNRAVDLNSGEYTNAINRANAIVVSLNNIKVLSRPSTYIPVEQRPSVLMMDDQIANAQNELQAVYAAVPTYNLPDKYNNVEIKL